jgi:two-component system cell cycle sensor histidine kinase/response regulator CckA
MPSSIKESRMSLLAGLRPQSFQLNWFGAILLILNGVLLTWSLSFYETTARDVGHTQEFLSRVQHVLGIFQDMETGQRGFLITGSEQYLEPYRRAVGTAESEVGMLRRNGPNDASLVKQLDRLSVVTKEKIFELDETIRLRREQGEEAARAIVMTGRGLHTMDELRRIVAQVELDASARLRARTESQQRSLHWIAATGPAGLLLALTFTVLATRQTRRAERAAIFAEAELKRHEGEFRLLADSIQQLAWMANADGWIFWYNRRWFEFTGTTAQEMDGWGWQSVHDPATLPQVLKNWTAAIATGEIWEMEFPLRGADGEYRSFLTRAMPVKNAQGRVVRWFGTNTDITGRVKTERASAQLAAIVESSEDAIIGKDLNGNIESWNAGAEKLYGYSQAEILGHSMALLLPPERSDEEMDILRRTQRGEQVRTMETTRVKKGGETVMISLNVSPIHNLRAEIVGASHIARDISERKEFEYKMHEMQKLETLGVLAGGIAHDFNNLLTSIMGNASLALERVPAGDSGRHFLSEVIKGAERAAALTRQLLAYAGKGQFMIEAVDLSSLAKEISQLVEASIPRKVQLLLELDPKLPFVEGDAGQLQQVIMNLVINGAEAIGEDRGTVIVRTWMQDADDAYLQTAFSNSGLLSGRYVALEVNDTGIGMDAATVTKIFDPFFTTKFTGRGLGLAAVQGIVRSHHGALKVYSTSGVGTSFKILLPAAGASVLAAAGAALPDPLQGRGRVLVIEDDEMIREVAKRTMENYGYSVSVAGDGQEGIDVFARTPDAFQLVFLDLTMPVLNGEEVFQRLQAIRPGVPVLLTSGFNANTALRHFTGKGLAGFLQKPYTAAQLGEKVKAAISAAQEERIST